jgi:hypothetical protein
MNNNISFSPREFDIKLVTTMKNKALQQLFKIFYFLFSGMKVVPFIYNFFNFSKLKKSSKI